MTKIHIIGGPGSGKSFMERISKHLNITRYDLDDIFWDNNAKEYGIKNSPKKEKRNLGKYLNRIVG
jgi:adenylate kinase family enzyme